MLLVLVHMPIIIALAVWMAILRKSINDSNLPKNIKLQAGLFHLFDNESKSCIRDNNKEIYFLIRRFRGVYFFQVVAFLSFALNALFNVSW